MQNTTNKDSLEEVELLRRGDVAKLLKVGISSVDLIPENELPKVHLGRSGKSVRYRLSSVKSYILTKEAKYV